MTKFIRTFIALVSLCLLWACAKESFAEREEEPGDDVELVAPDGYEIVEFQVTSEPSKTTLNGESSTRAVEWTKGDVIDIFWTPVDEESGTVTATATAAGPITQFRAVVPVGVTDFYATYPAGVGSYVEGQLKVRMPSEFNGSFAASNLMAAKLSRTEASVFQSVVSLLRFEVTDSDANSIRVSCRDTEVAKALRGVLPVSFDADGIVSVGTDTRTGDKTGDDNEKMSFAGAGVYYLPILADKEIQEGLYVEYFKNNIVIASLDVDFNFQLGRSYVADFGVIEDIMHPMDHHEYYVTVSGNGRKDGSSWSNAFGATEFKDIITRYAPSEYSKQIATEKEDALRNALFRIGGGTYNLGEVVDLGFSNHCTRFINFTFDGGYNSATGNKNPSNPTIFTGGDSHCIFQLARFADLGVIDCNFEHSSGTTGGASAVRLDSKYARLTLNGCNFNNNANTNTAGALSLGYGTATVMNCAFNNNSASIGAAISIDNGDDAAIYQTGAISISGCTFNGNTATNGVGGAVRIDSGGPVSIENSTFTNNTGNNGGALYVKNVREKLVVTGCTFGTSGNGNSSSSDGGAIRVADGSADVEFTNCTFTDNNSASSAGAISLQTSFSGTVNIKGGSFTNCSASTNGGAIYHGSGTLVVDGASFDGCSGHYGGVYGTTDASDGNAQFKNCDFGKVTRNTATERGGCIYSNSPNVTTTTHTFTDCWISGQVVGGSSDVNGGGARVGGGASPSFTRCTFDNCSAEDSGAFHIAGTSAPVFTTCTFSNCENVGSSKNGGAVSMSNAGNHPSFYNCTFTACHSAYRGGAVCSSSTCTTNPIIFSGCSFEGCSADGDGGAIRFTDASSASYVLTDCTFTDNNSATNAGAISLQTSFSGTVTLNGGSISSCSASTDGGAIYQSSGALVMDGVDIDGCSSGRYGGAFVTEGGTVNISNCNFGKTTRNTATQRGGCIYSNSGDVTASTHTFTDCWISGQVSSSGEEVTGGGARFGSGASPLFTRCTFDNCNSESSYGSNSKSGAGAVHIASSHPTFNVCTFSNCTATGDSQYGGAIRVSSSNSHPSFSGCTFENCEAFQGGAVYTQSSDSNDGVSFTGCEFTGCYGEDAGGAIAVCGSGPCVANDCNFHDNYGPWGTIYASNGVTRINGGAFKSNIAQVKGGSYQPGGALYGGKGTSKIYCNGVTFDGNTASNGAAFACSGSGCTSTAYFNACVFKNNKPRSSNGAVVRNEDASVNIMGFNNCSFLKNKSNISSVGDYAACWFNFNTLSDSSCSVLFSNTTIAGQPEDDGGKENVKYSGFIRVEKVTNPGRMKFVNTIIANTKSSSSKYGAAFTLRSGSAGYTPNFNANWCIFSDWVNQSNASGLTLTGTGNLGGNQSTHVIGNTTWFPDWGWKKLPGTTDYDYAGFNSLPTQFTPTTLDNVNAKIQEEDSAFYDWLSSIGALGKDIRGYNRAATTWPGAYDGNATSN